MSLMAGLCGLYLLPGIKLVIDDEDFVAKKLVNISNDDVDIEDAARLLIGRSYQTQEDGLLQQGIHCACC
jgi:hypothetical protein